MITTLQNKQRHKKLAKILANRKPRKKTRPSQRPLYQQSKHETRILKITIRRFDTSRGYWPIEALIKLADLGILSAIEYFTLLIKECQTGRNGVSPRRIYESRPVEDKYYHGIPNNISFQKLMDRLQAMTPTQG